MATSKSYTLEIEYDSNSKDESEMNRLLARFEKRISEQSDLVESNTECYIKVKSLTAV